MRATWRGYIVIGQLGFGVRLYSAIQSIKPRFRLMHEKDGSLIDRVNRCKKEDREIPNSEIVRAVELSNGKFITVTQNELEETSADKSKSIAVTQFSEQDSIDKIFYEKTFYIVPAKGSERAYALIRDVLSKLNKLAIAKFAIYNNEHVAAIGSWGDLLMLYQLRFNSEIVPRSQINSPALPKPSPKEVSAMTRLVEKFSGQLYIADYHDEQTERLNELLERKSKGLPAPSVKSEKPQQIEEDEIMGAIEQSLKTKYQLKNAND